MRADYLCCEQYVLVTWVVLPELFLGLSIVLFPILELAPYSKPVLTHGYPYSLCKVTDVLFSFVPFWNYGKPAHTEVT